MSGRGHAGAPQALGRGELRGNGAVALVATTIQRGETRPCTLNRMELAQKIVQRDYFIDDLKRRLSISNALTKQTQFGFGCRNFYSPFGEVRVAAPCVY